MKPTDVESNLTKEMMAHLFDIRPEEGLIYWKNANGKRACCFNGQLAGHFGHRFGYVMIGIDRKDFKRHRLIWFHVHGEWPENELDHINGNRSDDRISNLRPTTKAQNMWNMKTPATNKSGRKGVSWDKSKGRWRVTIRANGKWRQIGRFVSLVDAIAARENAESIYHGEFARAA